MNHGIQSNKTEKEFIERQKSVALGATCMKTVLPKLEFSERLRIEKRRAERSKAPLSIILAAFNRETTGNHYDPIIVKTLNFLQKTLRETDIIGFADQNVIGLLLPNTDEQGVQKILEKILHRDLSSHFSFSSGTYPDQIFERFAQKEEYGSDVIPLVLVDSVRPSFRRNVIKRGIDIFGALAGLLVLSPFMLIIAAIIKITSPGPIIFKQIRMGRKGVPFVFYKFRSMRVDTDDQIHKEYVTSLINGEHEKLEQTDSESEKPFYKLTSDPRITKIGSIMRKTSIDELPQLFNVLKGEMSLVGPRPPILYETEQYQWWHLRRVLEMKPGITGLWQVEGRSTTTFDDSVRLDVQYINQWSLLLDFKILLKTIKVVVQCNGAV